MKQLFFLLTMLLLSTFYVYAQVAVIQDADGYVNVRSGPDKSASVADTLHNGHIVIAYDDSDGNPGWNVVFYNKGTQTSLMGYIHKSRLLKAKFMGILPAVARSEDSVMFKKDSINVSITTCKFDRTKYRLAYAKKEEGGYLKSVNGKVIFISVPFIMFNINSELIVRNHKYI